MNVFITGGAGFLGRGILRRAEKLGWRCTIFSRDENKQDQCRRQYPEARYVLGDVRDTGHLTASMTGHVIVIHAAAIKFVDRAELNAYETININVGGSQSIISAARDAGIEKVVGISTDKAVQPVNIYGASKMAMERLFAEASLPESTTFICVRYGNVIGSTGSVIPLFKRQVENVGHVNVTNPNMTRFWMSVDEAVDLIALALKEGEPGSVTVPFVKAMEMSAVVVAAVGDAQVEIIGERPGEKEHEYLIHHQESTRVFQYKDHFQIMPPGSDMKQLNEQVFTLASHSPHYWMTSDEMKKLIADAETV